MKTPPPLTAVRHGLLLLLLAAALPGQAQTLTPPNLMSYQGYLTDGNGNPLGATNVGPRNYNVVFRLFNTQSTGTNGELYAEQQTVTVDNGYFSVLLGEGSQYQNEPWTPGISSVFVNPLASKIFVEFDVLGIGAGSTDVKIAPRLQLLSSPYAFLAANATSLANSGGTTLLTGTANGAVAVSGPMTVSGAINLGANVITGNGSGLTALNPAQLTSGTVTSALTLNNAGNIFSGNGSGLTALNASQLTAGTLPSGQLSGTYASALIFNNGNNSFTGNGAGLTSLNANNVAYGTLSDARLSSDVVRNNIANTFSQGVSFLSSAAFYNYVGISTSSPNYPLDVESWVNKDLGGGFWYVFNNGNGISGPSTAGSGTHVNSISIYASGGIQTGTGFYVTSDKRIKQDLKPSDSLQDLDRLTRLQVTDYSYKDVITHGDARKKGFIAQEVEKVFPQAVTVQTGVVPDIYQPAACKDGWVALATDLKPGDRVRLIADQADGTYEVLEVAKDRFRTDFKPHGDRLFVFGREVKDFRAVDYEAISVLNVSATQELAKRLEQKSAQVDALAQQVAALQKMVAQLAAENKSARLAGRSAAPARQPITTASVER